MTLSRLLVMRPPAQAGALSERLREIGCEPIEVPAIAIVPAPFDAVDEALRHLDRYTWIIVTSRNAVEIFLTRLQATDARLPDGVRWAAIGPATADALARSGVHTAWIPSRFTSAALAEEIPVRPGERVLRMRAAAAAEIATVLRARGAGVDEVVLYRTIEGPPEAVAPFADAWRRGVDGVILTSASTVRGFLRLAELAGVQRDARTTPMVAIGPVTAEAAVLAGLIVEVVATEHSAEGIVRALERRAGDGA